MPRRPAFRRASGAPPGVKIHWNVTRAILPATQSRAQDCARYVYRRIVIRGGKGDKDRNRGPQGVVSPADTL